jgi:DNA-binding response OmpR family regulator
MRVLVIDDEIDICLMVMRILRSSGIDCDYAHTLNRATMKTKGSFFKLFIIDINLPDGNGLDLIPVIKEKHEDSTIVIISAHDDQETVDRALHMGATYFIRKPFTKSEILALL